MKKILFILIISQLMLFACTDLDMNPLSEGSSENWYSDKSEIEMAVNNLYIDDYWPLDMGKYQDDRWSDDMIARTSLTGFALGTISAGSSTASKRWASCYKGIANANSIIANLQRAEGVVPQEVLIKYEAEAKFVRASLYSNLISHFGDVVYFTDVLDIDEAFTLSRTDKSIILQNIYEDYDFAISNLPTTYGGGELKRATKGAALGLKARIALYMADWQTAATAAESCINLGIYQLHPDFRTLFYSSTKNSKEVIFALPRSTALGNNLKWNFDLSRLVTRNNGGYSYYSPSWYLFCSFLCTDGLPIDESPLFDPHNPWKNRDPRCSETIVEPGTEHLGFRYENHPDSSLVWNYKTGKYQNNVDSKGGSGRSATYASYNGLVYKKFVNEDFIDDRKADPDKYILRYADVLLMYAEAKIENGDIDQSVLDAINQVRARAYKVGISETSLYPAVTTMDQSELRKIVRIERRMELSLEGLRLMDLNRWKLSEKIYTKKSYGLLPLNELREKVVDKGLWFFPQTPEIDEDGIANFDPMSEAGLIRTLAVRVWDPKQYLWPIPNKEILINENLTQNPGY